MRFRNLISAIFGTVSADSFTLLDEDGDDAAVLTQTPGADPDGFQPASALDMVDAAHPSWRGRLGWGTTADGGRLRLATTDDADVPDARASLSEQVSHFTQGAFAVLQAIGEDSDFNGAVTVDGRVTSAEVFIDAVGPAGLDARIRVTSFPAGTGTILLEADSLGAWTAFPAAAGWTGDPGSFQDPQYRRVGDMVQLRGFVEASSARPAGVQTLGTLPSGFRPPATLIMAQISTNGADQVRVFSNGNVQTAAGFAGVPIGGFVTLNFTFYTST